MLDEETGLEPRVTSASISDPYLLLVRDDSSVFVAQIDNNNELEELEKDDQTLASSKWVAGCLYLDTDATFSEVPANNKSRAKESVMMFLLNAAGALYVSIIPPTSPLLGIHRADRGLRYIAYRT